MYPCMSTIITVEGMSCEQCEQTVEEVLQDVSGVTDVPVDRKSEQASVEGEVEVTALVEAVEDAGYTAHA